MLYILFLIQIVVIFFTTRYVTNALFNVFYRATRSTFWSSWLLALVYLPGTLVHELAHFLTAIALLLPVKDLSLLPSVKKTETRGGRAGYYVKLGHVRFGHKDYFRTSIVGIAPFIVGLGLLYSIFVFDLFPTGNLLLNIVWAYLLFSITSSMFSSKKDMEGTIIFIPIIALVVSLMIGFQVDVFALLNSESLTKIMLQFNTYLAYGSVSNIVLFILAKRFVIRR